MRGWLGPISLALLMLAYGIPMAPAPSSLSAGPRMVGWLAYDNNPVMSAGAPGSWDAQNLTTDCVLSDGEGLLLYYSASNSSAKGPSVGLATSSDGTNWTKRPGGPVLAPGGAGSWDCQGVDGASVLKENGTYKMWYSGTDGSLTRIGYATSPDGANWTRHPGNPVLDVGTSPSWDDDRLLQPCVLKDKDGYRMYYAGHDGFHSNIGLAFSGDGVRWTKSPSNPVLPMGAGWEKDSVGSPCIIFDGDKYRIWYAGLAGTIWSIGHAQSWDGKSWVRHPENPVLAASQPWESGGAFSPAAWFDGSTYRMLYTGIGSKGLRAIGFALGNSVPNAPLELDPSSFEPIPLKMPEMTWRTDDPDRHLRDKMTAYEIQISDDPSFAVLAYSTGKQFSEVASHRPWKALPDGTHYWRVRTWDDTDQCGHWSEAAAFRVDTVPPVNPKIITCNTHKPREWSSNNRINVSWVLEKDEYGDPDVGFTSISPGEPLNITPDIINAGETEGSAVSPALADGTDYFFHFRAMDRAGNRANDMVQIGPFWIDTQAPRITSFLINSNASATNNSTVVLGIAAIDEYPGSGVAGMRFSEDGFYWGDWLQFANEIPFVLAGYEGEKEVHAEVIDWADNICAPAFDTIVWDNSSADNVTVDIECADDYDCETGRRPRIPHFNGTYQNATHNRTVKVSLHATDPEPGTGIAEMSMCADGIHWSEWEPFAPVRNLTLPEGDGLKLVKVRIRDGAGNIVEAESRPILLDTKAPGAVSVAINGGAAITNNSTVRLRLSAVDPEPASGLWDMTFSEDGANWTAWEPFNETRLYTFSKGDGNRTLQVRVGDLAMNAASPVKASILVDTTPPAISSVKVLKCGTTAATVEVVLSEACSISLDYGASADYSMHAASPDFKTTHVVDLGNLSPGSTYHFRATAQDEAGNLAEPTSDRTFTTEKAPGTPMGAWPLLAIFVVWVISTRRERIRPEK